MLVAAMVFASVWGVLQLAVLGAATRSVRAGSLALAMGAGAYACGVGALMVQLGWTRLLSALTGDSTNEIARWASYTVDPFIEEVAKAVPLLVLGLLARSGTRRGLTDYVLLGGALGSGFGLLEAMMRFGTRAGSAFATGDGWLVPLGLYPVHVPSPAGAVGQWLPAPAASGGLLGLTIEAFPNQHLVWSAIAGLGVGLTVRATGWWRLAGPVAVLAVGADHAANNYALGTPAGLGSLAAGLHTALEPVFGLGAFLALAAAVLLDVLVLRRTPVGAMALAAERAGPPVVATLRAAFVDVPWQAVPWTAALIGRLVLARRAARYAGGSDPDVEALARRLDAVRDAGGWARVPRLSVGPVRGLWPLGVWAVLSLPAALYYLAGSVPALAGLQDVFARTGPFVVVLLVPAIGALALLGWTTVRLALALRRALAGHEAERATSVVLRLGTGLGAVALGALSLVAWAGGGAPDRPLVQGLHVLDALELLLLAAGIALLIAAVVFFPPSVGLVAVAGEAGAILIPTIAVSEAFVTTATVGGALVVLSQVEQPGSGSSGSGSSGSSGSSGDPLPQKPPRPEPQVRNWRLRNIVRDLWKGTRNVNRVGDGTTMDAVRNEIATGQPTEGLFHSQKAQESINALNNWIDRFSAGATRQDVEWAYRLRAELQNALSSGGGG